MAGGYWRMNDLPKIVVRDEQGKEMTPKEIRVQEDSNGSFLITITIDNRDLSGERTFGT